MRRLPRQINEIVTQFGPQQAAIDQAQRKKHNFLVVDKFPAQILVADDMKFVVVAMKALLEKIFNINERNVTYVRDGQQAVDQISMNLRKSKAKGYRPFTLLIIDFNMPYLDGLQVVARVKDLYT